MNNYTESQLTRLYSLAAKLIANGMIEASDIAEKVTDSDLKDTDISREDALAFLSTLANETSPEYLSTQDIYGRLAHAKKDSPEYKILRSINFIPEQDIKGTTATFGVEEIADGSGRIGYADIIPSSGQKGTAILFTGIFLPVAAYYNDVAVNSAKYGYATTIVELPSMGGSELYGNKAAYAGDLTQVAKQALLSHIQRLGVKQGETVEIISHSLSTQVAAALLEIEDELGIKIHCSFTSPIPSEQMRKYGTLISGDFTKEFNFEDMFTLGNPGPVTKDRFRDPNNENRRIWFDAVTGRQNFAANVFSQASIFGQTYFIFPIELIGTGKVDVFIPRKDRLMETSNLEDWEGIRGVHVVPGDHCFLNNPDGDGTSLGIVYANFGKKPDESKPLFEDKKNSLYRHFEPRASLLLTSNLFSSYGLSLEVRVSEGIFTGDYFGLAWESTLAIMLSHDTDINKGFFTPNASTGLYLESMQLPVSLGIDLRGELPICFPAGDDTTTEFNPIAKLGLKLVIDFEKLLRLTFGWYPSEYSDNGGLNPWTPKKFKLEIGTTF